MFQAHTARSSGRRELKSQWRILAEISVFQGQGQSWAPSAFCALTVVFASVRPFLLTASCRAGALSPSQTRSWNAGAVSCPRPPSQAGAESGCECKRAPCLTALQIPTAHPSEGSSVSLGAGFGASHVTPSLFPLWALGNGQDSPRRPRPYTPRTFHNRTVNWDTFPGDDHSPSRPDI